MSRRINKVAVLGSGVMGSRIACHFANAGLQVLLLDIVPKELSPAEVSKGITREMPAFRNRIVDESLKAALKSNPGPVFTSALTKNIRTGNFDDHMKEIAGCDWVIEVVVENLGIKQSVFKQVEKFRTPGTLITSNTSGIPIHLMTQDRSEDFKKHFCGTHFFNPPRYLHLLEIIPTRDTDLEVVDFLMHYGDLYLGKRTVLCKDTPAFIANRVGVFSIMAVFHIMEELGLNIDEVDALTGTIIGRPKSATFRTADVVGIDTLVKVAKGLRENCPQDEARDLFALPSFLEKVVANNWLGDKTGQGFYKKIKTAKGTEILTLDLQTMEYVPRKRPGFPVLEVAKLQEDLKQRIRLLNRGNDKVGEFYREFHARLFSYISNRIPEIADELYKIDDAIKAGFGWETGPFETWDLLDVEKEIDVIESRELPVAEWVREMIAAGCKSFYKKENGRKLYYDIATKSYLPVPGTESFIILENHEEQQAWSNSACHLYDIGEGIVALSWQTKMNTIGGEVLEGVNKAIEIAERDFNGLIIANDGANFSAGANVGLIFMLALEQEWDELNSAVRLFQNTSMRIRYSSIPVIVAPHGLALGGGCEFCLHADKVQASAETYIGLVELGVGLIPAGGGSKEFALRTSDAYREGEVDITKLQERFITIGTAQVATSAMDAYSLDIFREGIDEFSMNPERRIADARRKLTGMLKDGYTPPLARKDVKVLGREGLGTLLTGINGMWRGHFISAHDVKVAQKLAWVMCGGDLTSPSFVSEQYLLDLEREAFLSLCGEQKTLERLQSVLKTGKPVRN